MIYRNKKELDSFAKTPKVELPVFKYNAKNQNLEVVESKNWQDVINSNKTLTLQEMIERNTYIESDKTSVFADVSNVKTDLNSINKESRINNILDSRLKQLKDEALKKQQELLQAAKENEKLLNELKAKEKEVKENGK